MYIIFIFMYHFIICGILPNLYSKYKKTYTIIYITYVAVPFLQNQTHAMNRVPINLANKLPIYFHMSQQQNCVFFLFIVEYKTTTKIYILFISKNHTPHTFYILLGSNVFFHKTLFFMWFK